MNKPQEETIAKVYPERVKWLISLALGMPIEKECVGVTHRHEQIRTTITIGVLYS